MRLRDDGPPAAAPPRPTAPPQSWFDPNLDWEGLLVGLRAGHTLRSLCLRPRFPTTAQVNHRRKLDADFAKAVEPFVQSKRPPPEAAFQAALQKLREGAQLKDVVRGDGQPNLGQPTRQQFNRRRKADPAFNALVEEALRSNGPSNVAYSQATWDRVVRLAAQLKSITAVARVDGSPNYFTIRRQMERDPELRRRILEHCQLGTTPRYDGSVIRAAVEAVERGESLKSISRTPGLPGRKQLWKRVRRDRELQTRLATAVQTRRGYGRWLPTDYQRALEFVRSGQPLRALSAAELPSYEAVLRWRRLNPGYDQQIRSAINVYGRIGADAAGGQFRRALSQNELYAAVDRVLGRGLDPFVREEVRSEMILAVLDGEISEAEITRETARAFVADYHRSAMSWGSRSLDAPAWEGGARTLHEVVAA